MKGNIMNYDDWEKSQIREAALIAAFGSKAILKALEDLLHGARSSIGWSMSLPDYWSHCYGTPDKNVYNSILAQYGVDDAGYWAEEVDDDDEEE